VCGAAVHSFFDLIRLVYALLIAVEIVFFMFVACIHPHLILSKLLQLQRQHASSMPPAPDARNAVVLPERSLLVSP
jgi:hypothetical protein